MARKKMIIRRRKKFVEDIFNLYILLLETRLNIEILFNFICARKERKIILTILLYLDI